MSSAFPQDLIIMGAPGTSYWTGSVLVFNTSSGGMSVYLDDESGTVSFGSYLGKYMQGLFILILVPFSQSVILYTTNSIICLFCVCFMRSLTLHQKVKHRKCLSLNFLQSSGSLQRKSEASWSTCCLDTKSVMTLMIHRHKLWLREKIVI